MNRRELTKWQSLRGFVFATAVFLVIFAASAAPIPLYADYQRTIGLTTMDVSLTMLTYLAGVSLTLLFIGRISDAIGRLSTTFFTLCLAIVGCEVFLGATDAASVLFARFIQGIASGLAMSAVSALVIDCVSERHLSWGSTVASCGSMFGIMLGSLGVGMLYSATANASLVYTVTIGLLAVCLFLLMLIPEPIERGASLRAAVKVRVFIPREGRLIFALVVCLYLATWMVSSFFQSFSSPIAYECFGAATPMMGSVILACVMAPSVVGGPMVARLRPETALAVGVGILVISVAALAAAVAIGSAAAFLAACVVFSVASGICTATSLRMLLVEVSVLQVSAVLASVNLLAYVGSAATGVLFGMLLDASSYTLVFAVQALIAAVSAVFVIWYVRHQHGRTPAVRGSLRFHGFHLGGKNRAGVRRSLRHAASGGVSAVRDPVDEPRPSSL